MNRNLRNSLLAIVTITGVAVFSSCSKDNETSKTSDEQKAQTITQYVDSVVIETYKSLADESIVLYAACSALQANPTQANIDAACSAWIAARKYWEQSEAFLFGAASDYNIDPHIDSWPLDKSQLDLALKNATLIANMTQYGCNFAGFSTLGYGLLGFHTIEYMIFRDGTSRKLNGGTDSDGNTYNALSSTELIYCKAVAEDLRNQCIRLEASWAGVDNVSSEKQSVLSDAELEPSMNYGESMKTAGETGNVLYKSQIAAFVQIVQGAADISDEVGNTKITDPVNSGNVLDVESWYSWNSSTDFADNIRSVQHAYLGSTSGKASTYSVSNHIKSLDTQLDKDVQAAITKAITQIEAIPWPFRNHLTHADTDSAKVACNTLLNKLNEVTELLQK
jgi:predicted lipoprotein